MATTYVNRGEAVIGGFSLVFKFLSLLPLFCIVLLISACNKDRVENYYLSLTGESDSWNLSRYEVVLNQEEFKAGNGTLSIKNENNYMTDWFEVITHVVISNKDTVVNHNIVSGPRTDLTEISTGAIEGPTYFNENKNPITIEEVDRIYMIVKWKDNNKKETVEERIDLYNKKENDQSF